MEKLNAIIIGDEAPLSPCHYLSNVADELEKILSSDFNLVATCNYEEYINLNKYDLVICYSDRWGNGAINDLYATALGDYVCSGGKLLILHNGISIANNKIALGLTKFRFTGHPAHEVLTFQKVCDHPIMDGIDSFDLDEEPYHWAMEENFDGEVFLSYQFNGDLIPAGWSNCVGDGKMVYLLPEHDKTQFLHPTYRQIVLNAAKFLS